MVDHISPLHNNKLNQIITICKNLQVIISEFGVIVFATKGNKKNHQIWPLDFINNSLPQI